MMTLGIQASGLERVSHRAGGLGKFRTTREDGHRWTEAEAAARKGAAHRLGGRRRRRAAGLAGEAPGDALARPRRPESRQESLSSRCPPRTLSSAEPRREGPRRPGPGEGGARKEDGAAPGALTSALPAAAGAGPGGARARPAHPPAAGPSRAPGSPVLRPPVPKLLNLRAAHALRGQRPTRRIGPPGRLGPALALCNARLGGPLPALRPGLVLSVAPPLGRSSQPVEGPVLRSHEGGNPPPLRSPTSEPAPLPGIHSKKRTGAPGPGVRSPLPHALARSAWSAGLAAARVPCTPAQTLCPDSPPPRALRPGDSAQPERALQLQASWGQNGAEEPPNPQFPYQDPPK